LVVSLESETQGGRFADLMFASCLIGMLAERDDEPTFLSSLAYYYKVLELKALEPLEIRVKNLKSVFYGDS